MPDETTTINAIKTASDGTVQIAVEKYNELLETISTQKGSISRLNEQLTKARNAPPVMINQTVVEKTPEMLAKEHQAWGITLMGLGVSTFVVGVIRFRLGRTGS